MCSLKGCELIIFSNSSGNGRNNTEIDRMLIILKLHLIIDSTETEYLTKALHIIPNLQNKLCHVANQSIYLY